MALADEGRLKTFLLPTFLTKYNLLESLLGEFKKSNRVLVLGCRCYKIISVQKTGTFNA